MTMPAPEPWQPAPAGPQDVVLDLLSELRVDPIIHAGGTKSAMGGAAVDPAVADVVRGALDVFVPIDELLGAIGDAAARSLGVGGAAIVAGAASGCVLAAAAVAREAGGTSAERRTVLTQRRHFGRYTYLYEQAGCRIREVGTMNDCPISDYRAAIDNDVVAIVWLEGPGISSAGASLAEVCTLAAECGLPVVVDAAAMAFPLTNIHDYLNAGADLVVVSGGKLLGGPQASGFVLGRADLVRVIREIGFPHQGVGRAHKIPKEVALGAYAALRAFVATDPTARSTAIRRRADAVAELIAGEGFAAEVVQDGRHALPAVVVSGVLATTGSAPSLVSAKLLAGRPRMFVPFDDPRDELYVEFASLRQDQDKLVARSITCQLESMSVQRSAGDVSLTTSR